MTVYDLLLKNATINDGTDRPTYRADIYINGGEIAAIELAGTIVLFYTRCSANEAGNTFNPEYFEARGDNTMYIQANPETDTLECGSSDTALNETARPSPTMPTRHTHPTLPTRPTHHIGPVPQPQDYRRKHTQNHQHILFTPKL